MLHGGNDSLLTSAYSVSSHSVLTLIERKPSERSDSFHLTLLSQCIHR